MDQIAKWQSTMQRDLAAHPVVFSFGILAWNEEGAIATFLESLLRQSIFAKLASRNQVCEIVCVANGCTDKTVEVAERLLDHAAHGHPYRSVFKYKVVDLSEAGKGNAWNKFVHEISNREAQYLYLADADIVFKSEDTLFQMLRLLEGNPSVNISTDAPIKNIAFKKKKSLIEKISLATTGMTETIPGALCAQLYCVRASVGRNLYWPKDLTANDDGFFKAAVCTDFFSKPSNSGRIVPAPGAAHIYEAYVGIPEILNNQKRQMIGQTAVYVLVEHLKELSVEERLDLANTLLRLEKSDPQWLRKKINAHLSRARFFWRIFPDVLTFRFRRWSRMKGPRKIAHLPAALAGFCVTLLAAFRAFQTLRSGQTQYWPKANRQSILSVQHLEAK